MASDSWLALALPDETDEAENSPCVRYGFVRLFFVRFAARRHRHNMLASDITING